MIAQLRSELLKQRTTRTNLGLLLAMVGIVVLVVALHGLTVVKAELGSASAQLTDVLGWGNKFGALFAGLLGAMSITNEFRHGTIRPTLLVTPRRSRVVVGKAVASVASGGVFGLVAGLVAAGVGSAVLRARGIDVAPSAGDYILLVLSTGATAALWAVIGVGVGALIRNQNPALIGITVWLLFIEGLLVQSVATVGRFAPGAAGLALSRLDEAKLVAPAAGAALLVAYAVGATGLGCLAANRRDVA